MWNQAVFIPASQEFDQLPSCIESLAAISQQTLLVIVLNAREDAKEAIHEDNQKLAQWLLQYPNHIVRDNITHIEYPNIDIHLIDHYTPSLRFASNQGVGTARDIGSRYISRLHKERKLHSPWIRSTDADARFDPDYLNDIPHHMGTAVFPYLHVSTTKLDPPSTSLQIYESFLRYYVLGLHFSGSPFAFPTIGSTIAIHVQTYQKSHGFPHRMAGEDFYLLAKSSKIAPVYYLKQAPILLIDRPSARVPFGTGPGTRKIEEDGQKKEVYHPEIFSLLKKWIHILNTARDEDLIARLSEIAPLFSPLKKLPGLLKQRASGARVIQRRHEWFDAFRTRKWVHHMRDQKYGVIPYQDAYRIAPFVPKDSKEDLWTLLLKMRDIEEQSIGKNGLG